ncbi:DUF6210 family protein [Streptomyces atratus]|uniref:DUF6210 family protein n=1 Tax=Streptomyces atratus TaxID=1893 RepID=UPI0035709742
MPSPRHVFLDPDGAATDRLYVVVTAPIRGVYQQQYGGTACRQGEAEGFLVPVRSPMNSARCGSSSSSTSAVRTRGTAPGRRTSGPPCAARSGTSSAGSATAWTTSPANCSGTRAGWTRRTRHGVPVLTPDGPGMLLRCTSD